MSMGSIGAAQGLVRPHEHTPVKPKPEKPKRRWFKKRTRPNRSKTASLRLGNLVIDLGELDVTGSIGDLHDRLTQAWLREYALARARYKELDYEGHLFHAARAGQILNLLNQVPEKPAPFYDGGG